jgi:hypothetical protein
MSNTVLAYSSNLQYITLIKGFSILIQPILEMIKILTLW